MFLVSILPPYGGAGHPVPAVLRRLVVVDHHRVPDDAGGPGQRQVAVGEEASGGGDVDPAAGDGEGGVLVLQVPDLAPQRLLVPLTALVQAKHNYC